MRIVGMMAAREESWILNLSIRAALEWCDHLVILLHMIDDQTRDLLMTLPTALQQRMTPMVVNTPRWDEMAHRQAMIDVARRQNPTHLAIIDADEVASVPLRRRLPAIASMLRPRQIAALPLKNLRRGWRFHNNGLWGDNRQVSVIWADDPKMGYAGDKFHSREPINHSGVWFFDDQQPVLHFWGFEERRLVAKHNAYKLTERLRFPDKSVASIEEMYNWATRGSQSSPAASWTFSAVPADWIPEYERSLVRTGQVPWQERFVRETLDLCGREHFEGLTIEGSFERP